MSWGGCVGGRGGVCGSGKDAHTTHYLMYAYARVCVCVKALILVANTAAPVLRSAPPLPTLLTPPPSPG